MVPPLHEEYTDGDFISPMELRTSISSFEYDLDGLSLRKFSSLVLYKGWERPG
jgi:hypothetical protein